jgi:hypothetical protein
MRATSWSRRARVRRRRREAQRGDLLQPCSAGLEQRLGLQPQGRDGGRTFPGRDDRHVRSDAECAHLHEARAQGFGGRGRRRRRHQRLERTVRRVQGVLGPHHPRLEIDEVDGAGAGAFRRIEVFRLGAAHRRQEPPHRARLFQRVEQRRLAGGQVGRPRMLQPDRRLRIEAAGLVLGVVQDLLLDLAQRAVGLRAAGDGLDAVDHVERAHRNLAQGQRAGLDHGAGRVVEALDGAADLRAVADELGGPGIEHRLGARARRRVGGEPAGIDHGVAAEQHDEPVREGRPRARCADDFELGRRRIALGDGGQRAGYARRVAPGHLVGRLGGEGIA